MPVGNDHGIKLLCPPDIDSPEHIVLSEGQLPSLGACPGRRRYAGEVFHCGAEDQVLVELVHGDIALQILPWNMMRGKRAVREPLVRETHGDVGNVRPEFILVSLAMRPCSGRELAEPETHVKELYTGVCEKRSCSQGAVTLGSSLGIARGGSISGGILPGRTGSSGPGLGSNILRGDQFWAW